MLPRLPAFWTVAPQAPSASLNAVSSIRLAIRIASCLGRLSHAVGRRYRHRASRRVLRPCREDLDPGLSDEKRVLCDQSAPAP